MTDITSAHKEMLEPFGRIFLGMDQQVRSMSDEVLQEMLEACEATSETNCWCCTFDAAKYLKVEIRREINWRKKRAAELAATPQ
jgi:hypothetical protein